MSNEAIISAALQISKGNLQYSSRPNNFRADIAGSHGPTPGAVTIETTGTTVNLSQLTTPGLCRISNIDDENYITWGVEDDDTGEFYPFGEILPGEFYIFRFSRLFGYPNSGTATTASFKLYANNEDSVCLIEAFET
jgi:hypothetical protein